MGDQLEQHPAINPDGLYIAAEDLIPMLAQSGYFGWCAMKDSNLQRAGLKPAASTDSANRAV
jgi:hypothetical protein